MENADCLSNRSGVQHERGHRKGTRCAYSEKLKVRGRGEAISRAVKASWSTLSIRPPKTRIPLFIGWKSKVWIWRGSHPDLGVLSQAQFTPTKNGDGSACPVTFTLCYERARGRSNVKARGKRVFNKRPQHQTNRQSSRQLRKPRPSRTRWASILRITKEV
jgi:hypothetical protein